MCGVKVEESSDASNLFTTSSSTRIAGARLLHGLITADLIEVGAQASTIGRTPTASATLALANLNIAGKPVAPGTPANTALTIAGVGTLVVNEQLVTQTLRGAWAEINAVDLHVTSKNTYVLPVGSLL